MNHGCHFETKNFVRSHLFCFFRQFYSKKNFNKYKQLSLQSLYLGLQKHSLKSYQQNSVKICSLAVKLQNLNPQMNLDVICFNKPSEWIRNMRSRDSRKLACQILVNIKKELEYLSSHLSFYFFLYFLLTIYN